jgi:L-lactate dehydrogenase complex protein LldF
MSIRVGKSAAAPAFPKAAKQALQDTQLRHNVRRATDLIRIKRAKLVAQTPDWQQLRQAGYDIKTQTLKYLDLYLEEFERNFLAAGGQVHWAVDADEANDIIAQIIAQHAAKEIIKVKTMTSDEVGLNRHLQTNGCVAHETDLADLIIQLGEDEPSHIVVPALHKNRAQIRQIFEHKMPLSSLGIDRLTDAPEKLTDAARRYLREKFLTIKVALSGANFAVADTGAIVIVESEGNARMCLSLPDILISLVGIEKIIPKFQDLEVFLQTLARSATGERMNPYTSIWTGVTPGDGPKEMHVVFLDNGRTNVLNDEVGRQTLNCIRCAACLNICPVYRQTGGHAYGSVYSGPIGAIVTPQLQDLEHSASLPFASSLCGACYEVCPVKINIPDVLIHLRGEVVRRKQETIVGRLDPENIAMQAAALVFSSSGLLEQCEALARLAQRAFVRQGFITGLPGPLAGWTTVRDLAALPDESFRAWWKRHRQAPGPKRNPGRDQPK